MGWKGRTGSIALLLAAAAWLWPGRSQAYPQWQLSTGVARCDQCHVGPAGGGLLTDLGRRLSGQDLATFSGDGDLLYGAARLPPWLALGADARGAYLTGDARELSSGAAPVQFPLEAEAQARLSLGDVALYATLGLRGLVPGDDAATVPRQNYQPLAMGFLVSREHWLLWQRGRQGPYLRAGRYFAPYGLRLAESATYIRRDLGFNQLEESYNLSGGYLASRWELHVTAFAPDVLRHLGALDTGAAAYAERRTQAGAGAFAVQAKYAARPGVTRAIAGAVGKYYVAPLRTLFLAEADAVLLSVTGLPARRQALGLAGLAVLPLKGLMLTALAEHYQEDLQVSGAARDAVSLLLGWFPYPHIGAQVTARGDFPTGNAATRVLSAELHYVL